MRIPMRPQTPLMPIAVRMSGIDLDGAGDRRGPGQASIELAEIGRRLVQVWLPLVPAEALFLVQLEKRVGPRCINHCEPGRAAQQSQVEQFSEGFAERTHVPKVA